MAHFGAILARKNQIFPKSQKVDSRPCFGSPDRPFRAGRTKNEPFLVILPKKLKFQLFQLIPAKAEKIPS